MSNGETVREIQKLLSEKGAIKQSTAQRLSLQLMADIYEKMEAMETERIALRVRVEKIEKASIILWIQNNPKLSTLILVIYILLTQAIDLRDVILKAFSI